MKILNARSFCILGRKTNLDRWKKIEILKWYVLLVGSSYSSSIARPCDGCVRPATIRTPPGQEPPIPTYGPTAYKAYLFRFINLLYDGHVLQQLACRLPTASHPAWRSDEPDLLSRRPRPRPCGSIPVWLFPDVWRLVGGKDLWKLLCNDAIKFVPGWRYDLRLYRGLPL